MHKTATSWNREARAAGRPSLTTDPEYRSIYQRLLTALLNDNGVGTYWVTPRYKECRNKIRPYALRAQKWVRDYFLAHPCVDCGEADPDVLDFDHRDPAQKNGPVPEIAKKGIALAEAEAAKCDVRCANCHRRRHARERRASAVSQA